MLSSIANHWFQAVSKQCKSGYNPKATILNVADRYGTEYPNTEEVSGEKRDFIQRCAQLTALHGAKSIRRQKCDFHNVNQKLNHFNCWPTTEVGLIRGRDS